MNLSKSRYTLYRQCPKALWLRVNKPEEAAESDDSRMENGVEVGNLAKGLFGAYSEATKHQPDGNLDLSAMIAETTRLMADSSVQNICEAAFSSNGCYCAVDILHRENGGWAIYEVKSSSHKDEYNTKGELKPDNIKEAYIRDIAYQKYVLEQCGVNVTGTYLVRLESSYVLQGEIDLQKLFYIKNVRDLIAEEFRNVATNSAAAKRILALTEEPMQDLHMGCHKPDVCAFKQYCMQLHNLPSPNVFNVYGGKGRAGFTFEKKLGYYYKHMVSFDDLRNEHIGKIQDMQIACTLQNKVSIDKAGIREFLKTVSYPLYHLDFETVQYTIPYYQGTHPSQQVPFQYSLHIEPTQGGECEHREFLADACSANPMRELAEQLCRDIPDNVCVLVYNEDFEKTRLTEMAEAFPDLSDHLLAIRDNIVDLLVPFRDGNYYVPAMEGSFSIKKVLPALFPNNPTLDYHNLNGSVHNGGEAMNIFPAMRNMTPDEVQEARKSLLEYCWLDTWSMVVILRNLYEVSK